MNLDDPTSTTLAVAEALDRAGIHAAVYGGLALAAYGTPRETKDADFAIAEAASAVAVGALREAGFEASLSFDSVVFGGNVITRIALLGGEGMHGFNVADLIRPRSHSFAVRVLERALKGVLRERPVTIVSPEDFVTLKVLSTRDRDIEDAANVVVGLASELDLGLIEREVALLSEEIGDHDVRKRFERVLREANRQE